MSLKLEKISKRFGNKWVLRDVTFEAAGGRIFGICGLTGAGKTVLLNAIAGSDKISGGTITLDSIDLSAVRVKDRDIYAPIAPSPKVLQIFGSSSKESTGEGHLASFEQALKHSCRVLLLDDPFCNMDAELRRRCFEKVREWVSHGERIVIFASSDFEQIAKLTDEMAILAGGDIKQTGTPRDIYENSESVSAVKLSGGANLFQARRLSSTDAELPEFQTIEGSHHIFARPTQKGRLGAINQNVTLAIRPEQISMSMGASFPEDNLLRAVVTGIRFRGATSIIEFDAAGLRLEMRVFKIVGLQPGDECMLGLPPDRIVILRD